MPRAIHVPKNSLVFMTSTSGGLVHPQRIVRDALKGFDVRTDRAESDTPNLVISIEESSMPEGAFRIVFEEGDGVPHLRLLGGGVSGVVYGTNEAFTKHIQITDDGFLSEPFDESKAPGLPYRILWTWDHSTNWYLEQTGIQETGALNYYLKPQSGFLEDYERLVDFMSLNRIPAVTIYGFLRDNHGGIEAAQDLCRYATERGVRIIPGVGINAYGGIYWEGTHRYNLTNWLKKNPQLRAILGEPAAFHIPDVPELWFPENQYTDAACPSRPENADFHEEAIQWLAESFDIGGINFETGDYGTCKCADCSARRSEDSTWSFRDMALLYPRLFDAAVRSGRDLWLVSEAYWDTILDLDALAPLKSLPDTAIYQFCVNRSYWNRLKHELSPENVSNLPHSQNIFRTHMGSQWNDERYDFVGRRFAEMSQLAHATGMQGVTIFGEVSAFEVANELNYLSFARFGYEPTLTWDRFVREDLAPLFGGTTEALKFIKVLESSAQSFNIRDAIGEAREIARSQTGDAYRRWIWLQNRLLRIQLMERDG